MKSNKPWIIAFILIVISALLLVVCIFAWYEAMHCDAIIGGIMLIRALLWSLPAAVLVSRTVRYLRKKLFLF